MNTFFSHNLCFIYNNYRNKVHVLTKVNNLVDKTGKVNILAITIEYRMNGS